MDGEMDLPAGRFDETDKRLGDVLADTTSTRQTILRVTVSAMITLMAAVSALQAGLLSSFSAGLVDRPGIVAASTPTSAGTRPPR